MLSLTRGALRVAVSIALVFLDLRLRYAVLWGATLIVTPLLAAMCVQFCLYWLKETALVDGFHVRAGFPVDPLYVLALFVALRVDGHIIWNWNMVLWMAWAVWLVVAFYAIVFSLGLPLFLTMVCMFPERLTIPVQEVDGRNYRVNPSWFAVRLTVLWVCAVVLAFVGAIFLVSLAQVSVRSVGVRSASPAAWHRCMPCADAPPAEV
jgi:hypothetical protein